MLPGSPSQGSRRAATSWSWGKHQCLLETTRTAFPFPLLFCFLNAQKEIQNACNLQFPLLSLAQQPCQGWQQRLLSLLSGTLAGWACPLPLKGDSVALQLTAKIARAHLSSFSAKTWSSMAVSGKLGGGNIPQGIRIKTQNIHTDIRRVGGVSKTYIVLERLGIYSDEGDVTAA